MKNLINGGPYGVQRGEEPAANTWVHLDVREFTRVNFLKDEFFIKSNNEMNFSNKIIEINN
jgi:hypothetical protein